MVDFEGFINSFDSLEELFEFLDTPIEDVIELLWKQGLIEVPYGFYVDMEFEKEDE